RQGDELVTDYDSMIAKLIVHAEDRDECIERSKRALREFDIEGVVTIIPFHRMMLRNEEFLIGRHSTKYLDDHLDHDKIEEAQEKWGTETTVSEEEAEEVTERDFTVEVNGKRFEVNLEERGGGAIDLDDLDISGAGGGAAQQQRPEAAGSEGGDGGGAAGGEGVIEAEMQGTILEVNVEPGDEIAAGDVVCVLEAMKMENDIVADQAGTVEKVPIEEDQSVDMGDPLVVLE
ncbi:MAG: acetyl-CoA/propionyl-CoA carboxylase biotin carboxyl carrier protein, partial [Halobacteriales archaeon]